MGIDLLLSTIAIRKEWEPDWLAAARAIAAIDFRSQRIPQDGRARPVRHIVPVEWLARDARRACSTARPNAS